MNRAAISGVLCAGVLVLGSAAPAAVQQTRDDGFRIQSIVLVDARTEVAWRSLIRVSGWWDPAHTWSGSAGNLRIEPRAGGCFCEKLPNGGSVEHARVVFAQPAKLLRLDGGLGPLQEMPVKGVLTYALAPDGPGTRITMTYHVAGALALESAKLAPLVDQVMQGQLDRLRDHINGRSR
jgi:hypothetical protein